MWVELDFCEEKINQFLVLVNDRCFNLKLYLSQSTKVCHCEGSSDAKIFSFINFILKLI